MTEVGPVFIMGKSTGLDVYEQSREVLTSPAVILSNSAFYFRRIVSTVNPQPSPGLYDFPHLT